MEPIEYPVTYEVSDIISITANFPHSYTVKAKKFGFNKKLKKMTITEEEKYTSKLRHAIKICLEYAFDSDLIKILDRLDEIEKGIDKALGVWK